jgi:hypothetical protein
MRRLQAGWRLTQQHKHARGARGSEQKRSDGQREHHVRSGITTTIAPADRAGTALVERQQRRVEWREKRKEMAAERPEAKAAV